MLNNIAALLGGALPEVGDYESIATTTLTGNQATITFSSIPSTYSHLQLRIFGKDDRALNRDSVKMQFNSDTAANYSWHYLLGDGSVAAATAGTSASFIELFRVSGNSSAANIFGAIVVDVLDYANANKYKTSRALGGVDFNGSGEVFLTSGSWRNTAAVSSITLTPGNATNFMQYSSFALYGIK
jgi:hypothetical protein